MSVISQVQSKVRVIAKKSRVGLKPVVVDELMICMVGP